MDQTDLLIRKSFANPSKSIKLSRKNDLFKNKPTPGDSHNLRIKMKSSNSKTARRKAYDKLRKSGAYADPEETKILPNRASPIDQGFISNESNENLPKLRSKSPVKNVNFELEKGSGYETTANLNTNELLENLQPEPSTPRTAKLLEILGQNTPIKTPVQELVQPKSPHKGATLNDVATVGKVIGQAIADSLHLKNAEKRAEQIAQPFQEQVNAQHIQQLSSTQKSSHAPSRRKLDDQVKLHYKNPIRVNRISKPVKTESDKLKQQFNELLQQKKNLDQNFKYLEDDILRNNLNRKMTKEQEVVSKMMESVSQEIGSLPGKEIERLTRKPSRSATMAEEPVGKYNYNSRNTAQRLKGRGGNMAPRPSAGRNLDQGEGQVQQPVQLQYTGSGDHLMQLQLMDYISKNFVQKSELAQAQSVQHPVQQPAPVAPTNYKTQPLVEPISRGEIFTREESSQRTEKVSPEKSSSRIIQHEPKIIKLTSQKFPNIDINPEPEKLHRIKAKSQAKKQFSISAEAELEVVQIEGCQPKNPEDLIKEKTIDQVYNTAMAFVEREVTAAVTEKLIKSYLDANNLLYEKYRNADLENILIYELEKLIRAELVAQNSEAANKTASTADYSTLDFTNLLPTPSATPTASPQRSPIQSTRHSINSFRQSLAVDPIPEEIENEEPKIIPEFEHMSVAVDQSEMVETEPIVQKMPLDLKSSIDEKSLVQPEPSGRVETERDFTIPEDEEEPTKSVTVLRNNNKSVTIKSETKYSTELLSENEKTENTFTQTVDDLETSPTISYGQLLIEPGELKFNKNIQPILPKIYENEEPGEIDINQNGKLVGVFNPALDLMPDLKYKQGEDVVQLLMQRQMQHQNRNHQHRNHSLDTQNDVFQSFPQDFEENSEENGDGRSLKAGPEDSENLEKVTPRTPIKGTGLQKVDLCHLESESEMSPIQKDHFDQSISEGEMIFNRDKFARWRNQTSQSFKLSTENDETL